MNKVNLTTKLVGSINGDFFIADYQRGYRWREEVEMLLNDISEMKKCANYCLQPIVVKNLGNNKLELIDGQQRLTTLYLIQKYIKTYRPKITIKYTITYQTRENSKKYLEELDFDSITEEYNNIDEYFICEAAKTIKRWFERFKSEEENRYIDDDQAASDIQDKLNNNVNVIWYEVDSSENSTQLFTRLNIGKIPLTNAELVKALFLSRDNGIDDKKQLEIATQWDSIEKELRNDNFWYFITNENAEKYPTRIELVFNLMAKKKKEDKERFRTFFYFSNEIKKVNDKFSTWQEILRYYQKLKEWYENFELYHKVGYLVSLDTISIQKLLSEAEGMTKSDFQNYLDKTIAESIKFEKDYSELLYENNNDRYQIEKLLLLFNVETIRQKQDEFMRFPFERHKKEYWSLEHIHAQNSDGLNKDVARKIWLIEHKEALKRLDKDGCGDLIDECEKLVEKIDDPNNKSNIGDSFNDLFKKIVPILSENGEMKECHTIDNLALLSLKDNSTLNNSTFDVKRNKIINMDKTNDYIPVCTRRVFLKYYTESDKNQYHYWGKADREAYIANINEVLEPYFKVNNKKIELWYQN